MDSYHYTIDGVAATSMISQLGCPFECGFCGGRFSPMLRRIRTRPKESVVLEMLHLYDTYGYTGIMFYDDELNVNRSMVELMREIASTGIHWRLRGFVKAELFTDEQAEVTEHRVGGDSPAPPPCERAALPRPPAAYRRTPPGGRHRVQR